jgi:hypothetical protein
MFNFFRKRQPRFQVIVQIPSGHCIFRTANSQADVDEWVKAFEEGPASNLKVYEYDPRGAYELKLEKGTPVHQMVRPIGFCR